MRARVTPDLGLRGIHPSLATQPRFACSVKCINKLFPTLAVVLFIAFTAPAGDVGVASVDFHPGYSVRRDGCRHRTSESEGVTAKLYAKPLAYGDDKHGAPLILAVDSLCVPDYTSTDVAARLK